MQMMDKQVHTLIYDVHKLYKIIKASKYQCKRVNSSFCFLEGQ